jgi:hypothetical protein
MPTKEDTELRDRVIVHLTDLSRLAQEHSINVHGGGFATACHECMNIKEGIFVDRAVLSEIEEGLLKSDKKTG